MKHTLLEKYNVLFRLMNEYRNVNHKHTVVRKMTHSTYIVEKIYGISFVQNELFMYSYYKESDDDEFKYGRIPLSEFSEEDQIYHRETQHSYISLSDAFEALKDEIKSEFIGKTVKRILNQDNEPIDEMHEIEDIQFEGTVCFVIRPNLIQNAVKHEAFV